MSLALTNEGDARRVMAIPNIVYKNVGLGKPLELVDSDCGDVIIRYCAFCTKHLDESGSSIKCGKCMRRIYCSDKCLKADWDGEEDTSQGHKNWCNILVGEEGLDWHFVLIDGKRIGVRALRKLPPYFRIMVEAMDYGKLEKIEGGMFLNSKDTKRNHFYYHECDSNAAVTHENENGRKVTITYSRREILKGEQITKNYTFFNDLGTNIGLKSAYNVPIERILDAHRQKLNSMNIICQPDCFCLQPGLKEQLILNEKLSARLFGERISTHEAKQKMKSLLRGLQIVKTSPHEFHTFLLNGIKGMRTIGEDKLADKFVALDEIYCKNVHHPDSKEAAKYFGLKSKNRVAVHEAIFTSVGVGKPLETENNRQIVRFTGRSCAFCTEKIAQEKVKYCSKCHVRAYCSKECQVSDWSSKGKGQGHKNWCGLQVGEEGVDWEVVEIKKRGLGVRAMRNFSACKIIFAEKHSKMFLNHECDANAEEDFELEKNVSIILAKRDIKEGEEICLSYMLFNDVDFST